MSAAIGDRGPEPQRHLLVARLRTNALAALGLLILLLLGVWRWQLMRGTNRRQPEQEERPPAGDQTTDISCGPKQLDPEAVLPGLAADAGPEHPHGRPVAWVMVVGLCVIACGIGLGLVTHALRA
jgi:hypothetical protein